MEKNNDFINENFAGKEIETEVGLLKRNINRMFITDDRSELYHEYSFAKKRIDNLYGYNLKRIDAQ
ncbi:MAG: hypothetical protein NC489_31005 [Ruminococcus flavefaciens]|nr:hypothetical protein [Ruminococcus flavefaciens]